MGGAPFWAVWAYNFAFDGGRYAVAAVLAFLVFWVWGRERWRPRLVAGDYAPAASLRREIGYSAGTAVVFSLVGTGVWYGRRAGVFHVYERVADHGWAYFAFTVVVLVVVQDTYFYWTHRAMHHPWLFRRVHLAHHRSANPSPFAAYAFSPLEALMHAAFVPLVLLALPLHPVALFLFLAFMILRNVLGHLGIELYPRWFVRSRWSRWSTTTTHHALHHRHSGSNFGLYFTWWDRIMGTTDPAYERTYEAITSAPGDAATCTASRPGRSTPRFPRDPSRRTTSRPTGAR
jgi:sterol desaturase/sphingolipid hydroxylase (fatty acid hydroxylase superfamily)